MKVVPKEWMPNCSMKRIITHWTAGAHKASSLDKAHYHILIESDGKLVKGTHSIQDNVSTADNRYAAHTAKLNTGSIGVSVCCMSEATESPLNPGKFPMTKIQWETMAQVVAELCQFYDIPVTRKTVLGHGEVEKELAVSQGGKWDPMVLPWEQSLSKSQVGDKFRSLVEQKIAGGSGIVETPATITTIIKGQTFREAQIYNEKSVVKVRPLADTFHWTTLHASADSTAVFDIGPGLEPAYIRFLLIDHGNNVVNIPPGSSEASIVELIKKFGFVTATDLAKVLNLPITWDGATRTITVG